MWVFYSVITVIVFALRVNLFQLANKLDNIKLKEKVIYVLLYTALGGLMSMIFLLGIYLNDSSDLVFIKSKCNMYLLVLLGLLLLIAQLFQFLAILYGNTHASMLINFYIVIAVIGSYLFFEEQFSYKSIMGLILSIIAIGLIIYGKK